MLIITAQSYLKLPQCAALNLCSFALRNCVAPRYVAAADSLGGVSLKGMSTVWQSWSVINPDKLERFLQIVLRAPTLIWAIRVSLPTFSTNATLSAFCGVMQHSYDRDGSMNWVRVLNLRKCQLLTNEVLPHFAALVNLEVLDVSFTQLREVPAVLGCGDCTEGSSKCGGKLPWLKSLSLGCVVGLRTSDLAGIAGFPRLERLDLTCCRGVGGTEHLRGLRRLRTCIGGGGLPAEFDLSGLRSCTDLDLSDWATWPAAWGWFGGRGGGGGDDDDDDKEHDPDSVQPRGIEHVTDLHRLDVSGSGISSFNFLRNTAAMRDAPLQTLIARGCENVVGSDVGATLGCARYLRYLDLSRIRGFGSAELKQLEQASALEYLDLSSNASIENVNRLGRAGAGLSRSLAVLLLKDCANLTQEGIYGLEALRSLEHLDLSGCSKLTAVGFLGGALPLLCLRWLSVAGCVKIDGAAGAAGGLEKCASLKFVDFRGTAVFAEHVPGLLLDRSRVVEMDASPQVYCSAPSAAAAAAAVDGGGASTAEVPNAEDVDFMDFL